MPERRSDDIPTDDPRPKELSKSGTWKTGEEKIGRQLGVDWWAESEGFTWDSHDLSLDQAVSAAAWERVRTLIAAGDHNLVVLDEIIYPINWKWIDVANVVETIINRPEHVSIVLTGRNAPAEIIDVADTVSEIGDAEHASRSGIRAKKGIDF